MISTLGILLNAAYFLWSYQRIFLGKLNEKYVDLPEINRRELFTLVPLAVLVILLGIYPSPVIDVMKTTMANIIELVQLSPLMTMP